MSSCVVQSAASILSLLVLQYLQYCKYYQCCSIVVHPR